MLKKIISKNIYELFKFLYQINHKSDDKLQSIYKYAVENSKFYSNYCKYNDGYNIIETFKSLPILEKDVLRSYGENGIRVVGAKGTLRKTSGSTGIPIKIYVDNLTIAAQLSARWNFFGWHGLETGDPEVRFWGRAAEHSLFALARDWLINRTVISLGNKNSDIFYNEIIKLTKLNLSYFYGYASLLVKIADVFDRSGVNKPRPKVIISTAEMLTDSQRKYISDVFDCPVVQEYGCSEVDIIAFECEYQRYHINHERIYVEFLKTKSDRFEVIVTDLDNRCTPLLRYRLGDLVEITSTPCRCGRPFSHIKNIKGRAIDRIVPLPNNGFVHAVVFSHIIDELNKIGCNILQFKVEHYEIDKLIFKIHFKNDCFSSRFIQNFILERINNNIDNTIRVNVIFGFIENDGKFSYYNKYF